MVTGTGAIVVAIAAVVVSTVVTGTGAIVVAIAANVVITGAAVVVSVVVSVVVGAGAGAGTEALKILKEFIKYSTKP